MLSTFTLFSNHSQQIQYGFVPDILELNDVILLDQMHGDRIVEVTNRPNEPLQGDALISRQPNIMLAVKIADCQGILMYDPVTHTVAAVHSGWRGSALDVIGKSIQRMKSAFGVKPENLLVAISPSLGPCCAVFSDPKNELPAFCHRFIREGNRVDFWTLSLWQCDQAGVPAKNIELSACCTKCTPGYRSHRNGDTGRMGVFIKINSPGM